MCLLCKVCVLCRPSSVFPLIHKSLGQCWAPIWCWKLSAVSTCHFKLWSSLDFNANLTLIMSLKLTIYILSWCFQEERPSATDEAAPLGLLLWPVFWCFLGSESKDFMPLLWELLILHMCKCGHIVVHVNGVAVTECEGLPLQTIPHFVISRMSKLICYTVKTQP